MQCSPIEEVCAATSFDGHPQCSKHGAIRNEYKVLERQPLTRRHEWEDYIEIDLKYCVRV